MQSGFDCGICCDLCFVSNGRDEKRVNNVWETRSVAGVSRLHGFGKHAGTMCADRQLVKGLFCLAAAPLVQLLWQGANNGRHKML